MIFKKKCSKIEHVLLTHGDEDVDQEDDGDELVERPDHYAHEVGELDRQAVDVDVVLLGAVVDVLQYGGVARLTGLKDPPEHGSPNTLLGDQVLLGQLVHVVMQIERFEHEVGRGGESYEDEEVYRRDVKGVLEDLDDANHDRSEGSVEDEPSEGFQEIHGGPVGKYCRADIDWMVTG